MDSLGRTSLELTAINVADELRNQKVYVTYDYTLTSMLRKPLTIVGGFVAVFAASWIFGQLDVSIGKGKA